MARYSDAEICKLLALIDETLADGRVDTATLIEIRRRLIGILAIVSRGG